MLTNELESSIPELATQPMRGALCQLCGVRARVHVLVGYENGQRKTNDFCISCATHDFDARPSTSSVTRQRIRTGAVLIALGILVAGVGAIGAFFDVSGHAGFGWYQRLGVGLGVLVAICGGLLRIELLALAGAIVAGAAAMVDFMTHGSPTREWLEFGLTVFGLCFMLVGLFLARRTASRTRAGSCSL